ncbi:hypothetical protein SAMN05421503_2845 [Terribacillus aidingensis]|uniref:Uncharacterized protein n=1 Tax=Terribacillus aidingensis TaxID=586416 RepID=A0A285P2V2_9BACI|nr:hypothetical protein SAMN05421503_2845 [Terribacillus aidingensis]
MREYILFAILIILFLAVILFTRYLNKPVKGLFVVYYLALGILFIIVEERIDNNLIICVVNALYQLLILRCMSYLKILFISSAVVVVLPLPPSRTLWIVVTFYRQIFTIGF